MLSHLIQFALTQRIVVMLGVVLLVGGGWYSLTKIPIDAFPDISSTQVKIIIKAPGMTPEEVEARITAPIEVEMLGIPNQSMLRSVAKYALTDITVDFSDNTDIYWARQQVAERLNNIWGDLPAGISGGIAPMTTPLGEMFMFTIDGGNLTLTERRTLLDWVIRPVLRTVPGVADVNSLGGLVKTFEVVPSRSRMNSRGVSIQDLISVLEENNRNDGAGRLNEGEESLLVRTEGSIQSLDDVRSIVVKKRHNVVVRIVDVADVRIGSLTRYGAVTRDGESEAVEGLVLGLRGANAHEVVRMVKQKLADLAPSLPEGVETNVFYDRSILVDTAVQAVAQSLGEAIVLVLILLVLFLGSLRAALTVAMILPLAAFGTFVLMKYFNMSANLMSLGGLAIAIGMLVDAAVVIVENIITHLARAGSHPKLPRLHIIYRAVREVSVPVTSGIAIIIIVFLPLLTLQGLEGKLFIPVALTIVFALGSSLLLSLIVIPVLASLFLKNMSHKDAWLVRVLLTIYGPVLKWSLRNPIIVVVSALIAFIATGFVYTLIGKSFMPTMDEGDLILQLEKLPSINLEQSVAIDLLVQRELMKRIPEITGVVARVGSDEIGLDPMGLNETDSFLVLKPQSEWRMNDKEALMDEIRRVMNGIAGVSYGFNQPIEMRVSEMLVGVRGDLAIKVFGADLAELNKLSGEIKSIVEKLLGAEDVRVTENEGVQYLQVKIDRLAAGRMNLSVDDIEVMLRAYVEGTPIGNVHEGARRTPLVLRGSASIRSNPDRFMDMQITLPDGRNVPLSAVARLERIEGPVKVDRERGQRMAVVTSNVRDRDLVGFVDEAKLIIGKELKLPTGYRLEWGGQFENQQRAAERLSIVVPISLALIFLLLFTTFGSIRQSLLILGNIPFALIGGIFALWISGEYLSVPASVGFIVLLGVAVLNGVVLVSYFNQLKAQGMAIADVVVEGAKRRLRPVLMTASIAAFGLVPLLFASGPGSEIQRPLAIVVIGGLVTSTLLTLIVLPIMYRRFGFANGRAA